MRFELSTTEMSNSYDLIDKRLDITRTNLSPGMQVWLTFASVRL